MRSKPNISCEEANPEEPVRSQWMVAAAVAAVVGLTDTIPVMAELRPARPAVSASVVPATDSPEMAWWRESMKTHEQRIAWWREARFGMFIHWGVYSQLAGEWKGEPVVGYAEHIQRKS